jgi:hypothetical protein
VTPESKEHVTDLLATAVSGGIAVPGLRLVDGGMETLVSAYLVLATPDNSRLFIVERRNDDGESAAQLYTSPLASTPQTRDALWRATAKITDETKPLTAAQATALGVITSEPDQSWSFDSLLTDLLFGFRDILLATSNQVD